MAQLRQDYEDFVERETRIIVIGPEGPEAYSRYWADNDLPFTGLPDPEHRVLKLYGQQINLFKFGRMPAQAVIDKAGVVRYVHYGKSMADIPDNPSLLDLLDEIDDPEVSLR
jgi:peroxiredoxin Q/BCP